MDRHSEQRRYVAELADKFSDTVELLRNGHWSIVLPNGERVTASSTPSDGKSRLALRTQVARSSKRSPRVG